MKESFHPFEEKIQTPICQETSTHLDDIMEYSSRGALSTESYEDAAQALDAVEKWQDFRKGLRQSNFRSFYDVFEVLTRINQAPLSVTERKEQIEVVIDAMEEKASRFSPRVADLYLAILSKISGKPYEPKFQKASSCKPPFTEEKISELEESGDLWVLTSSNISWEMKLNHIETRLGGYLAGVRALDRREGNVMDDDKRKEREEELKKAPTQPPDSTDRSKPGVDPMERLKEGERAPAIWAIDSGFDRTKYFKQQSFSRWDDSTKEWVEEYTYDQDVKTVPLTDNTDPKKGYLNHTLRAMVSTGRWKTIPVPYTHDLHNIDTGGRKYHVRKDQNGDLRVFIDGSGESIAVEVVLAPHPNKKFTTKEPAGIKIPEIPSEFSAGTIIELKEIAQKKHGNLARAKALASYVRAKIEYLAPKDRMEAEQYNRIYRTSPKGFAGAVDEVRKGDCDVVNTYFAALCAKLNIPARHCVGHSVKGRDKEGVSSIHSGTGHAWSEVWDEVKKEWDWIDATPAGDPNLEDSEEQIEKHKDFIPGDTIEQEAICPSDAKLEELRQKLAEHKEKLSYTPREQELAEATGVELKEARQIVKELKEADQTRLPNGEKVVNVLSQLFNSIVRQRRNITTRYEGPVRKSEGGETITHIIPHVLGHMAGDTDPASREKPSEEVKKENVLGGFDLYIIGDKSGSMTHDVEGEALWQMQRRAVYLIFSSLYRFQNSIKRAHLPHENALSVRTQSISFRGSDPEDIDLDKPLSSTFSDLDKVKLWQSLTHQGGGNGDVAALSYIYEQIKGEREEVKKTRKQDTRLRLIIACSDGGPDDPAKVHMLAEELGKLGAVVVGVGLTEASAAVPIIYNTPYSRGDIARDINDLPMVVAKHVVLEAVKLFPDQTKDDAKQEIEKAIRKLSNINKMK